MYFNQGLKRNSDALHALYGHVCHLDYLEYLLVFYPWILLPYFQNTSLHLDIRFIALCQSHGLLKEP